MYEWNGLVEFMSVAEHGSMSKAAEVLGVTKSSISKRILLLEKRLDKQLLHRQPNGVTLTRDGEQLLSKAAPIITLLDELHDELLNADEPSGEVRLSLPLGVGETLLQPIILAFQLAYPKIHFLLHFSTRRVNLTNDGYDLCFRLCSTLSDEKLVAKKLWHRPYYVCASPEFIRKYKKPQHPSMLAYLPCLSYCENINAHKEKWPFKHVISGEEAEATPHIIIRSDSVNSLVHACLQGSGILHCSEFFIHQHLKEDKLIPVLTEWTSGNNSLWLVFPTAKSLTKPARLFVDFTERYFKKHYQHSFLPIS